MNWILYFGGWWLGTICFFAILLWINVKMEAYSDKEWGGYIFTTIAWTWVWMWLCIKVFSKL